MYHYHIKLLADNDSKLKNGSIWKKKPYLKCPV